MDSLSRVFYTIIFASRKKLFKGRSSLDSFFLPFDNSGYSRENSLPSNLNDLILETL